MALYVYRPDDPFKIFFHGDLTETPLAHAMTRPAAKIAIADIRHHLANAEKTKDLNKHEHWSRFGIERDGDYDRVDHYDTFDLPYLHFLHDEAILKYISITASETHASVGSVNNMIDFPSKENVQREILKTGLTNIRQALEHQETPYILYPSAIFDMDRKMRNE